ncbi:hypothetical protein CCACVL1_14255 [Corchorus capsularis]|uniref:Thionin-like protein 2 n=1 Tax=Corchorus capsularis TaxID=210143 RepID=A0A1R3I7R7_COCAP|nr:hypothetical protein CCACVL1_14255 [Corchorus capsularis]
MEAGRRTAAVMSLVVLAMVVMGQGRELGLIEPDGIGDLFGPCAKSCGKKCALKLIPKRIAACFGLCAIGCLIRPSQAVLSCASNCANSRLISINPTDAEGVEAMVGSCYSSCNQNNNF